MKVKHLKLLNFKNFKDKEFHFSDGINLITAANGSGKTNVLDSIRTLCYGKPLFSLKENNCINLDVLNSNLPYTKVIMRWENNEEHSSSYTLSPTMKPIKSLVIDNLKKTQRGFIGLFNVVWFSPETINIITSAPKYRREILDAYFCQLSSEYFIALTEYQKALDARNRFLKIQDRDNIYRYLYKFDEIFAKRAKDLIEVKNRLIIRLKKAVVISSLLQNRYNINFELEPNISLHEIFDENIYIKIVDQLKINKEKDIATKRTNTGPHKDDWTLTLSSNPPLSSGTSTNDSPSYEATLYDLRYFGSRGQKRMGLLIFTLSIVHLLDEEKGSKPVLLLDDVVSELDDENISLIISMLNRKDQQSIITSTHSNILGLEDINLITL